MTKTKELNLSKSKYTRGKECPKILWLEQNKPEVKEEISNDSVFETGTNVGELAKNLFGSHEDIAFSENLQTMILATTKALEKDEVVITEASFVYDHNFCSVDLLKKKGSNYEMYEVKSSTDIKDIYLDDIAYQAYVLLNNGLNLTKACLVYINKDYERKGSIDLNKLFTIKDVTTEILNKQKEVASNITKLRTNFKKTSEPENDISLNCFKPYPCPFFKYCTKNLPEPNVFNIRRMPNKSKLKLYHDGICSYEDLLKKDIDWKYKEQIEFELFAKEPKQELTEISNFLDSLSYPLYFLDFETFQQAIPEYDGIKPFMQIPFQYSLHYFEAPNTELKHKEFLANAGHDPRRSLAESLVRDIPLNVCTLAYNMSFEKTVIKNLANLYPDLRTHLLNIHDSMCDLMLPFKNHHYYTGNMQGSYSIKYVLPALFPSDPSLDYHSLNLIHNGSEAMTSYANIASLSPEEQQVIRDSLLKYCELDTYAMVKIWQKLKEVCQPIKN